MVSSDYVILRRNLRSVSRAVHARLLRSSLKVATAESCTGGMLSCALTDYSGSSKYFVGGIVSYSNEIKSSVLGIRESLLRAHGAVSEQVASLMAAGVLSIMKADLAISITGIAGPTGGSPQKPVGLVYIGLAKKRGLSVQQDAKLKDYKVIKNTVVKRFLFNGDRDIVRLKATISSLEMIEIVL